MPEPGPRNFETNLRLKPLAPRLLVAHHDRAGTGHRAGVRPSGLSRLSSVHQRQSFGAIPLPGDLLRSDRLFDRVEVLGG